MDSIERIEDFYKKKLDKVPDSLQRHIGHFNVFRLAPFVGANAQPVPYSRRDYYKVSLIRGSNKVHYADKAVEIKQRALMFANPQVPYNWEEIDKVQSGYFCVFTAAFFHRVGNLGDYALFQPHGVPIFELSAAQGEPGI